MTSTPAVVPPAPDLPPPVRRRERASRRAPLGRTGVLALASVASFMVSLDLLVITTALETIRRDIGASPAALQWTLTAYSLSFAGLLMTGAALGDRFGRRRVLAAGLAVFVVGSAAAALSGSVAVLVAARVVQGAGGAWSCPSASPSSPPPSHPSATAPPSASSRGWPGWR